jgi:small neutral amino acid transporter SnatA (MarC family)
MQMLFGPGGMSSLQVVLGRNKVSRTKEIPFIITIFIFLTTCYVFRASSVNMISLHELNEFN